VGFNSGEFEVRDPNSSLLKSLDIKADLLMTPPSQPVKEIVN
jgi:hypothetical protein